MGKVVGDSCVGGWQPQKYAVPCPLESRLTKGAYSVLGTISMIAIILTGITYLSRSEHFKTWFNYGFESFNGVKYATIGAKSPESALESVTLAEWVVTMNSCLVSRTIMMMPRSSCRTQAVEVVMSPTCFEG